MNKLLPHRRALSTNKLLGSGRRLIGMFAGCAVLLTFACGADARPVKWEYLVVNAGLANRLLENLLNRNGAEGWELIQINAKGIAVFKRPKAK